MDITEKLWELTQKLFDKLEKVEKKQDALHVIVAKMTNGILDKKITEAIEKQTEKCNKNLQMDLEYKKLNQNDKNDKRKTLVTVVGSILGSLSGITALITILLK